MLLKIRDQGNFLNKNEIAEFEEKFSLNIPSQLREFLLKNNGGRPTPNFFPIKNHPEGHCSLKIFLRINGEIETSNFDWNIETYRTRLPLNILPFARSDTGDLICLNLNKEKFGQVLFWDSYKEGDEPSYDNIYEIAPSFQEFLDSLFEYTGE